LVVLKLLFSSLVVAAALCRREMLAIAKNASTERGDYKVPEKVAGWYNISAA